MTSLTSHMDEAQARGGIELATSSESPVDFDATAPSPARMYDYYLGGKDNFAADRAAAEKALSVVPDGRQIAWANRRFLVRAVKYLASRASTSS